MALDQGTGKVLWKTRSFGVTCYDSPMLTTIGNREMVLSLAAVNMNKSMVAGLDPAGGQVLWTYGAVAGRVRRVSPDCATLRRA